MIRKLQQSDINGLNVLTPPTWNYNYETFLNDFIHHDYFYAFVLIENDQVIGTGNVLLKGKIGWLANIIVDQKYRGKGFGFEMSQFLVNFLVEKNCKTQLLIATELGEAVYTKLGFKKISEYICFDSTQDSLVEYPISVQKLGIQQLRSVCELDFYTNNEDRSHLISKFFKNSVGIFGSNNRLIAAYVPNFGRGLILSKDPAAGLELLKLKHAEKDKRSLIPIENELAIKWMRANGLKEGDRTARMYLGKKNNWKPELIYSYGSGYCG